MAVPEGTAKFREETSKKADSAANRIAATHNLVLGRVACKPFFALQHCRVQQTGRHALSLPAGNRPAG
jgi:hypothetical protein